MTFSEPGADDVENLYARIGTRRAQPDVRRPYRRGAAGRREAWTHPPFAGEMADGELYGRGAVDMKGGIACAVAAVLDHLARDGGKPNGSISFLITGDEEGIAVNGTPKLLAWAAERGEKFDHCILGEPSNVEAARRHHQDRPARLAQRPPDRAAASKAMSPIRSAPTTRSAGW